MAFYVSVPRDLSRVKTKVFFNLTKRQIICFGLAACIGIPVFFLLKDKAGTSVASMAMIFTMLPLFFMAMYEKNGMPVEELLRLFYESRIRRPKQRPYKTDNYYTAMEREEKARKEIDGIVKRSIQSKRKSST